MKKTYLSLNQQVK